MPLIVVAKKFARRPNVTRAFSAGAIVSCAIGFYGSIMFEKNPYAWVLLLLMTIGNAICIFGSMMFGFEELPTPAITFSAPQEKLAFETQVRVEIDDTSERNVRTVPERARRTAPLETRL